jgi:microcystin-dependent protein
MSDMYIAEVRIFGFNFAPVDWAVCNGAVLDISQNSTLFQIIGTTYGGNGQTTFGLPQLQDLTTVGAGQGLGLRNWQLGATFGEVNHTLTIGEAPQHTHVVTAAAAPPASETKNPTANSYPGEVASRYSYSTSPANTTLNAATIGVTGGSQAHPNIQPVQATNYCIALFGVFPPQS